jgi:capsid protein
MSRRESQLERLGLSGLDRARSDYSMAKRSGAQKPRPRGVPSQGAGADYHYRTESDWLWMCELAWDIYRNNMCIGSIVDRAVEQTLQDGFSYDPNTGDKKLDEDMREWWSAVSEESNCDPSGELSFADQEEIVLRSVLVGGDIFALPMEDGSVGLNESQFCRSPSRKTKQNIAHGVEQETGTRRRTNYWFLDSPINPFQQATISKSDLKPIPAYAHSDITDREERNVFHVRVPKRVNQTRGLTSFAPIFDVAGYHDDVQFLKLVQARASSLFVFVRNRTAMFDPQYLAAETGLGPDVTADKARDVLDQERQYKSVAAGSELKGLPGEQIAPWSSTVPNPEFFPHVKLLLTFVGINLGMPLVMALMDASETNFSGYRGAVDQARQGFKKNQRRLIARFHRPYLRFKIIKRAESDSVFRAQVERSLNPRTKVDVFRHKWNPPNWPYIEPTKDATADLIRDANMLTSPRRRNQERGQEWSEIYRETADDRDAAFRYALDKAAQVKKDYPDLEMPLEQVARMYAPLPMPTGVSVSIREDTQEPGTGEPSKNNDAKPANK